MNTKPIPAGYREDYRGALIPESSIKEIDLLRDKLTLEIVDKAKAMHGALAKLKGELFQDIKAFLDLSAEQYDVKLGGKKGNVSLHSFDGRFKIIFVHANVITFDERLQAAKGLIDECLQEWSTGAHPGLITLVNDAFRTDNKGELRSARVLGLRRHNIDDPRWKRAMDAISDALQVVGTTSYVRVYERVGTTDKFQQITLDLAAV